MLDRSTAETRSTAPELSCAWCGVPLETRTQARGRTVCPSCGAATTDPWPSPAELDAAYARYRPPTGRFSGPGDALLRLTRSRLAKRIDEQAPGGRVLDIGAGDGTLLDALGSRGRPALGLERDPRREDVLDCEVTEVRDEFAAVVFWHSLEHVLNPGPALDHAAGLLAPGGLIAVAAPNTESLQARLFGDRWFHLDLPRHLVHLPATALVARLRDCGLEITRVSHWRGGQALFGWLHGIVGRLAGVDLYDAIRMPEARSAPVAPARRAGALALGAALLPLAAGAMVLELALRRGGTVYVEARRG